MIGTVTPDREAILPLTVTGAASQSMEIRAVIDTGFTDSLLLPRQMVTALGLAFRESCDCILADGGAVSLAMYEARVQWLGRDQPILVLEADGGPLIGMGLLHGSRLTIDVVDGGSVTVSHVS